MFARVSAFFLFFVLALCTSASAAALAVRDQCNTGSIQCCNSVQAVNDPLTGTLAGLLGVVLDGLTGQVGLGRSPLSIIGVGGNSW
ncbi:putative hydrophobin [Lyophyllum shimeji]|uniref:Hydrophobin n=1 Tax=Lyophyllum shimeji TaxID=47721 RepID=A0A9P3PWH7_LYOSH|nr:putative hydrophobin [Lyophyllum shimeji]